MRSILNPNSNFQAGNTVTGEIPILSGFICNYAVSANTAKAIAVPAGASFALLNYTDGNGNYQPFFLCDASVATAVLPTTDKTDGTGVCANRQVLGVAGIANLSVIAQSAGKLNVEWFTN